MPIVITGYHLEGASAVIFGSTPATSFTVNSDGKITAIDPVESTGTVDVRVTTLGGTSSTSAADHFTYNTTPVPTIAAIAPTSGTTAGGTIVQITGTGFVPGTTVSFGGTAASSVTIVSTTFITAVAPAESAGTVHITVTTVGGTSSTSSADQYTYTTAAIANPSNSSISEGTLTVVMSSGATYTVTYDSKFGYWIGWYAGSEHILEANSGNWQLDGVNNTSTDEHNLEFGDVVVSW